jgi:hypothetical protein
MLRGKSPGKFHFWHCHVFEANGLLAIAANEMNMIIMMMPLLTILLTERITNGIICAWYAMNDALFNKYLECAVNGNSVEFFASSFFNIRMRKRSFIIQK